MSLIIYGQVFMSFLFANIIYKKNVTIKNVTISVRILTLSIIYILLIVRPLVIFCWPYFSFFSFSSLLVSYKLIWIPFHTYLYIIHLYQLCDSTYDSFFLSPSIRPRYVVSPSHTTPYIHTTNIRSISLHFPYFTDACNIFTIPILLTHCPDRTAYC